MGIGVQLPVTIHHAETCAASTVRRVAILTHASAKSNGLSIDPQLLTLLTRTSVRMRGNEVTPATGSITAEEQQAAGEV